jgi:hypothetical protein
MKKENNKTLAEQFVDNVLQNKNVKAQKILDKILKTKCAERIAKTLKENN